VSFVGDYSGGAVLLSKSFPFDFSVPEA